MLSAFKPGERVLTFNWLDVRIGDVVVFEKGGKKYLKRVLDIKDEHVYVAGDNKKESSSFAPFNKSRIVGKVIFKY